MKYRGTGARVFSCEGGPGLIGPCVKERRVHAVLVTHCNESACLHFRVSNVLWFS